jgi:hypothetical protein
MPLRPTIKPATRDTFAALVLATSTLAGCGRAPATPLAKAASAGDAARLRQLLETGADPDDMAQTGLTPLMYAARAGHVPVVLELVRHGARPDLTDKAMTGWTALIHAIHKGQNAAALALLEGGAHPDVRVGHGATALLYAAAYGNTPVVRALLARGADPHVGADGGATPLWAALGGGGLVDLTEGPAVGTCFPETADALLERAPDLTLPAGASEQIVNVVGRSPVCRDLAKRLRTPTSDRSPTSQVPLTSR